MDIKIRKIEKSRIVELEQNNLQFGKLYSDHMLVADYKEGAWQSCEIVPFENLSINPATTFIHYGQSIFEGVKAYYCDEGKYSIFRPEDNFRRMNISAERMGMPQIPHEIFIEGMKQLIELDKNWIPSIENSSLYIRPFMFATDEFIGVKPAEQFRFMIICSPSGPYYSKPVNIYIQKQYIRAFPGGIGFTKAAGNYGAVMKPTMEIRAKGYDQILWTDGFEHKFAQEIGTMNVFFVLNNKVVVTPDLEQGTILEGVTRKSCIQLLKDNGYTVEERPFSIDEMYDRFQKGELLEVFGTGTAASIAPIGKLDSDDFSITMDTDNYDTSTWLKNTLNDIKYQRVEDKYSWNYQIS